MQPGCCNAGGPKCRDTYGLWALSVAFNEPQAGTSRFSRVRAERGTGLRQLPTTYAAERVTVCVALCRSRFRCESIPALTPPGWVCE
jgi:hypothetical protein